MVATDYMVFKVYLMICACLATHYVGPNPGEHCRGNSREKVTHEGRKAGTARDPEKNQKL